MFCFQAPYFFLLLIPLVFLVVRYEFRRISPLNIIFSNTAVLQTLPYTFVQQLAKVVPYLLYVGVVLWIVALARPQFGEVEYRVRTEGIALIICIDRSGSMAAMDFTIHGHPTNRLEVVKHTLRDFIYGNDSLAGRQDDKIGLLAFGGYVDAHCPLTLDHATLLEMLDQIQLPNYRMIRETIQGARQPDAEWLMREGETAIGDALAMAADRLREEEAKSKVILFLSDGEQTAGVLSPMEGAEIAQTFGIKVYTIGIGSTGEAPYVFTDSFGRRRTVMQGVSMDEQTLKDIAELTGGRYFNARNTRALEEVYAEIDQLEKTMHEGRVYRRYTELFRYPLFAGAGLIALHVVCVCTRFRRLP
ncbi:MAG: VWA domain-containing protein [Planctomycetaceae bacterium]|nr:VWA domain-containing protein [Planctomycetaceae bacterium]